jgi:hypothetical protein
LKGFRGSERIAVSVGNEPQQNEILLLVFHDDLGLVEVGAIGSGVRLFGIHQVEVNGAIEAAAFADDVRVGHNDAIRADDDS